MKYKKSARGKTVEKLMYRRSKYDDSQIQIFILDEKKTFFKNKITVSLQFNSTIKDLKNKIKEKIENQEQKTLLLYVKESKYDCPSDIILRGKKPVHISDLKHFVLWYDGKTLKDENKKLIDYGITIFSTINLISKEALIKGGGAGAGIFNFVDLRKEKIEKVNFSEEGPNYRTVTPGLNIIGLCTNKKCETKGNEVIVQIGFGEYDLGENISEMEIRCPICEQVVKPKTCGFTGCAYNFIGEILEGKNFESFKTGTLEASDKYFSYYKPSEKLGKWSNLKIYTLPTADQDTLTTKEYENINYFDF